MQHATISQTVDTESVRHMAYEIWVKGGRREGMAEQNWLEAERILNAAPPSHSTHTAPSTPPESNAHSNGHCNAKDCSEIKRERVEP